MIGRLWHGWTSRDNAGAYEALLRGEVLPGIRRLRGHAGACLLRPDAGYEVEFVTLPCFDSIDAVRAFAAEDHEKTVAPPQARRLLPRFDERSAHHQVILEPPADRSEERR